MTDAPFQCPECGDEVSPNAAGCRSCGAQKVDGEWRTPESYDGLDLPGEDFDYDEFIRREFGEDDPRSFTGKQLLWWVTAVVTLVAFLWISLSGWW